MKVRWIISGALLSFAVTFVLVFIIAVASYSTDLSEGAAGVCAYAAAALGVFFGAYTSVVKARQNSLLHAMCVSAVYAAAIIAASLALNGRINTGIHSMSIMAGVALTGFLAAVIGGRKNLD